MFAKLTGTLLFLLSSVSSTIFCTTLITHDSLISILSMPHPFSYNLDLRIAACENQNAEVTLCFHGYGGDSSLAERIHVLHIVDNHILGFNFPDYGVKGVSDYKVTVFGSIKEILPALYILNTLVNDKGLELINLYGFSAGGGAIINLLGVLKQNLYDEELKALGITAENRLSILSAIERGVIILDCPLKSIEEIMEFRGMSDELEFTAQRYRENNMRPIDSVQRLAGIQATVLLNFQDPDEVIGNKDDALFIERLKEANRGTTCVIIGREGGHLGIHDSLWNAYTTLKKYKLICRSD